MELQIKAVLTGILFGLWPLLMNKSGLSGNAASFTLAAGMLICFLPFSVGSIGALFSGNVKVLFVLGAIISGSAGILLLNGILAKTNPQAVSALLVLIFVTQIVVPSIYHIFVTGGLTLVKGTGFALAVIAAILLVL